MTNADSIEKRIPIWFDTDPGVDDAMAMALLFAILAHCNVPLQG